MKRHREIIVGSLVLLLGCGGNDGPTDPTFATLAITTTSLPNAVPGAAYSQTLTASGGDGSYQWSVSAGSLPAGLSLVASGAITGTPTGSASTLTVQVSSGDGQTATQQFNMTVNVIVQADELCSDYPATAIATFEDANLEAAVRATLGVGAQDDLTCALISGISTMSRTLGAGIISLVGMQNLTSLTFLEIGENSITDLSPLAGLTGLSVLSLDYNSVTDLGPLTGLTNLTTLDLSDNGVTDITVLSGLMNLTRLAAHANPLADISALTGLTSLTLLDLGFNSVLTNIQPLLDNTGLGEGDTVLLNDSPNVTCTDVALLEAKGVTVDSDLTRNGRVRRC